MWTKQARDAAAEARRRGSSHLQDIPLGTHAQAGAVANKAEAVSFSGEDQSGPVGTMPAQAVAFKWDEFRRSGNIEDQRNPTLGHQIINANQKLNEDVRDKLDDLTDNAGDAWDELKNSAGDAWDKFKKNHPLNRGLKR